MIKRFKSKSDFTRNVLTLMTGTTIAQAIPIAISPILTRMYTPEDFGVFGLFLAISSIFSSIANGRYELAIMLPKKDEDAINIFALGFIITTVISFTLFLAVFLFQDYFLSLLNNPEIGRWLYFVPVAVFFTGLFNILSYFNNRRKNYKDIASATITKSIVLVIVQLSIGYIKQGSIGIISGRISQGIIRTIKKFEHGAISEPIIQSVNELFSGQIFPGASGLIGGQIMSSLFANIKLLNNIIKDKVLISKISKVKIIALAKRYKNFPKYSMWAILANTLSINLTNILISSFFSIATLGFYSLVQRILGMPSSLIGKSIGQVFFQEATKEKLQTGKASNTFNSTAKKLVVMGIPSFGILYFIVEDLFAYVFGEEWRVAGEYSEIVVFLFAIRFVSSPLSTIMSIFERQKQALYVNIVLISTSIGIIYISSILNFEFKYFLTLLTIFMSINYLIFFLYYKNLSKGM